MEMEMENETILTNVSSSEESDEFEEERGDVDHFMKFVILHKIWESDLEIYNEDEYLKYVLNDINYLRKRFGISERDVNTTFILFTNEDFLTEYKSMFYNASSKELLDHKFMVAESLLKGIGDTTSQMIEFDENPLILGKRIRDMIALKRDENEFLTKPEHIDYYFRTGKFRISNEIRRRKKIAKKNTKLGEIHKIFLKELINKNRSSGKKTTVKMIRDSIMEKFPISKLDLRTVRNFMKGKCNLSYKKSKVSKVSARLIADQDLLKRFIVAQFILDLFEFFEIIFIDECYFHSSTSFYSWAPKGESLDLPGTSGSFKIGVCAAISKTKFLGYKLLSGVKADQKMFMKFLDELILNILPSNHSKKIVLFLDNSSVHRAKSVREFCENKGIKMVFNAPYSPDFNPIENLFNLWKTKIHTQVFNSK